MVSNSKGPNEQSTTVRERHREAARELIRDENIKLYLGGEWVDSDSGQSIDVTNPTTGEPLATVQAGNRADVERAVTAAWRGFDTWSEYEPRERQQMLTEIADRIDAERERFAQLDVLDNGKPITEARIDIELVVDHFRYFAGALRTLEGRTVPTNGNRHVETIREPYGVVGQITPWNFPLLMAAWKLAPALAAGNAVVLKPAEETPLSLIELVHQIDDLVPAGTINVVTGYGPEAGRALVRHDRIRKLAFTGAVETGRGVMKDAAGSITDLTLELGGKSPILVFPDADVDTAVDVAIDAMFYNTGECCCAGSRLFVHEAIHDEFVSAFVDAAEVLTIADPLLESTDIGPEITRTQLNRTEHYIKLAEDVGAEILIGGRAPASEALADGNFIEPTIIAEVPHDTRVVQEEIFGPVELVFEWTGYDEMMRFANNVDFGLAAGIVTDSLSTAHRAARDIEAGNIWVNQHNDFPAGQPFGGYKQSGIGRETARETIEAYTQTKTINYKLNQ
ncbi:aldehyde dehydrogenase family protein [Natronococcus wangiae]|uniref:aldehyde dehydrogenase family protein n=1 Tax=Natronococcus wangiae TaxID=3068275 RepID=UPI00273D4117|nr:aldehyde dehydrogenase family protein [Natronococcus sp. AD5]